MADKAGNSSTGAPLAQVKSERPSKIIKPPGKDFEVFINFRGPDSRSTVVDILYNALASAGFGVFYDDVDIDDGEVIAEKLKEGIEKSKIYLPIFSKEYASSKWCLRELDWIIKCWEEQKEEKMVIPIFYKVDVSTDLKLKPKSSYKVALNDHEGKVDELELDGWEDALTRAAEIKGKDVDIVGLTTLAELIVEDVSRNLRIQSDPEKEIDDYVGMRERREEFINGYLKLEASDVRVVAIYGVTGMGKTTLARLVFKKLSSHFPGGVASVSVTEVRKKFGKADTVDLQKDLLSQLLKVDTSNLVDTAEGVNWIKERVKPKGKVLIVLDGLDNVDQVQKLAGDISWFGIGSRIIITTNNIGIMPAELEGFCQYQLPELNKDDARKLICRNGIPSDAPREGYDDEILTQAVEMTGGNPTAIRDIASEFRCNHKKRSMRVLLEDIKKDGLNSFRNKLMLIYENFQKNHQQIFLDVACLFIDKEWNDAFYYWKSQDRSPEYGIMVLENFSFIEIVGGDKLWMDRPLRDFGRKFVDDEDIPSKRSRLWSPEVAFKVVSEKKGTENVVALNLGKHNGQLEFDHEQFKGFTSLSFLELNGGNLKKEDFNNGFSELKWLSWVACQPEFRTINCSFKEVLVLMLSNTQITDQWGGWHEIKEAKGLKVLKCKDCCSLTKSPDFSSFLELERLVFSNCPRLQEIDQSIDKLRFLTYLEMRSLFDMKKLPVSIGNVKSLSVLKLELENLTELPATIVKLEKLKHLCLWCPKLNELPETDGNLTSLVELDISHTRFNTLPEFVMNRISTLKVFEYKDCGLNEKTLKEIEKLRSSNQ